MNPRTMSSASRTTKPAMAPMNSAARSKRPAVRTLMLAVLALLAVVAVRPPHAPPLYDGLGAPDEPYRWVVAPLGAKPANGPVTTMTMKLDLTSNQQAIGGTAESGPQLKLAIATGGLQAPAGSTSITITGTASAAPAPPAGGTVVSNLYTLSTLADRPGPVTVTDGSKVLVNLRADVATEQAVVLESWDGAQWAQLATRRVGTDIYAAFLPKLVPIALVKLDQGLQPSAAPGSSPGASAGATPSAGTVGTASPATSLGGGPGAGLWIGFGAVVILIAGLLLLARRRAAARGTLPPPSGPPTQ